MKFKTLLISITISLGVGFISALITMNNQNIYQFIKYTIFIVGYVCKCFKFLYNYIKLKYINNYNKNIFMCVDG